jgi:hypothetical protein
MGIKIITADERLATHRGIKGVITGPSKIGKTSLAWTLDAESTLMLNAEAGELSLQGWQGDMIDVRSWEEARDLACWIGGANPALRPDQSYSGAHYDHVVGTLGDPATLEKYQTIFVDSITVASRLCLQWCKGQPQSFSERTGRPDNRGTYGLLGQEMIAWLTQLQHTRDKHVWLVGILDEKVDDYNRRVFSLQIEGAKTGLELPGIVDEVISMVQLTSEDDQSYRAFVCHAINPWGYPAGDRSGRLNMIEEPHLGRLMEKISGPVKPAPERISTTIPAPTPTPVSQVDPTQPNPSQTNLSQVNPSQAKPTQPKE